MNVVRSLGIWVGFGVAACAAEADQPVLRIGTEAVNYPVHYTAADGTIKGMEIDIGDALCERIQRKCVWVNMEFSTLIPALQAHKIDVAFSQISITEERRKVVDFSDRVTSAPARLVARKGSGITDDPATLKGRTIGVQSGTTHERYLEERLAGVVTVRLYPTQDDAYLDLESGRIDATLGDQDLSWDWLQKSGKQDFEFVGMPLDDKTIFGDGTGIAFRKDEGQLRASVNQALAAIVADGTFDRISAKYFPFPMR
jgi:lysine/arginine/ornithine transport system substrate-binding protein